MTISSQQTVVQRELGKLLELDELFQDDRG